MQSEHLSVLKTLLDEFKKALDANSVDTMLILITNLMNQQERYRLKLTEKELIDLSIITAQNFQRDRRLADTLMWMYSCLLSKEVFLSVGTQEQVVFWAHELHHKTKTESSALEFGWVIYNFIQRGDFSKQRYNLIFSLNVDGEFWQTVLHGQIGLSSFLISTKLLCCFLRHDGYKSSYISVNNMNRLIEQFSQRAPFNELVEEAHALERTCLMGLIKQWLSSSHALDAHFHIVVQRLAGFVKIIECTQTFTELQAAFELISMMINGYHEENELQLQLTRNMVLFRALLARFDQTNSQPPTATIIAGLTCLENLLNLGGMMGYQANGTIDMEYYGGEQMRDQRDNPFKEECLKVAEFDYLENLQHSKVPEVAK